MENALKIHKSIESEIEAAQKMVEKFEDKAIEIEYQKDDISKKIIDSEKRLKADLLRNVKGEISDSSIDKIRSEIDGLKKVAVDLDEKSDAIDVAKKENMGVMDKLKVEKPKARQRVIRAAFDDLAGKIPNEVIDIVHELWSLDRHTPGGDYRSLLLRLFPMESLELLQERWNRFVKKTGVEH